MFFAMNVIIYFMVFQISFIRNSNSKIDIIFSKSPSNLFENCPYFSSVYQKLFAILCTNFHVQSKNENLTMSSI